MNIVETNLCVEWFRRPATKKRRIRNKWKKNPANHRPARKAYLLKGGTIICHPEFAETLRAQIASTNPAR